MTPQPSPEAKVTSATARPAAEVIKKLEKAGGGSVGIYGVYVESLADGVKYGVRQDEVFPAASLMKLPILLGIYLEVEKGKLDLEETYTLREADKIEWTTLASMPAGSIWTYRQLLELAGKNSDSSAAQILLRKLGTDGFNNALAFAGMERSSLEADETTPRDVGEFFSRLYRDKLLQKEHKEELLSFLTETIFEDRIPVGIPDGVRVSHKIGTEDGGYSDGGIVFGEKPFILVVMSKGVLQDEAPKVMAEMTRIVWEYEETL